MITRFDHAVIAVRDIDAAIAAYTRLGFETAAGGRHPSLGTRNAIVRFGLDYLELLAIEDIATARARGPFGAELADFLAAAQGLVGFVLASDALDDEVRGLTRIDLAGEGPFAMDRVRPDGRTLAWRLVLPGGSPWRKPWPFLIEWATADAERLRWDAHGQHANGACAVRVVELLVADLGGAARLYEEAFGLPPAAPLAGDGGRSYRLGDFELWVRAATDAAARAELNALGAGPYCLHIGTRSLAATAACLQRAGIETTSAAGVIDIAPTDALGARLRFVAQ